MLESLTPDLVLVLPPHQRAEAIRALPPFEPWQPAPLGLLLRPVGATSRARHALLAAALLYFLAKLALMISTAAAVLLAGVALVVIIATVL
jgi:hypothetical protein